MFERTFLEIERYAHCTLGRIALDQGMIDCKALLEAIKAQQGSPEKRIGEIFVEKKYLTGKQLETILTLQKSIFLSTFQSVYIPDVLLKGAFYFRNIDLGIRTGHFQEAEEKREESFVDETEVKPLEQILVEEMKVISPEKMKAVKKQLLVHFGKCPKTGKVFRLFGCNTETKIVSPIACNYDLIISDIGEVSNIVSENIETMNDQEQSRMSESPDFLKIYHVLKKMEPFSKKGFTEAWSRDSATIRLVFQQFREKHLEQDINIESDFEVEKTEELQSPLKEATKEVESEEIEIEEAKPATVLQKVVHNTRRLIKKPTSNKISLGKDLARLWYIKKNNMASDINIAEAFFVMARQQKSEVVPILHERGLLTEAQLQQLQKITKVKIEKSPIQQHPFDLKFYQYLNSYEILENQRLRNIANIQSKLSTIHIRVSLEDLLVVSKFLGKDMVESLVKDCTQKINEEQQSKSEEVITRRITAKKAGVKSVSFKETHIQSRKLANYTPVYVALACLVLFYAVTSFTSDKKPQKALTENTQNTTENTTTEKPDNSNNPSKNLMEPTPINQNQATEKPAEKKLEKPTNKVKTAIALVTPKILYTVSFIEKNYKDFQKSGDLKKYQKSHKKWQDMSLYMIAKNLPAQNQKYDEEIQKTVDDLHILHSLLSSTEEEIFQFVVENKDNLKEFRFSDVAKKSKVFEKIKKSQKIAKNLDQDFAIFKTIQ